MALTWRPVPGNFNDRLFEILKQLETPVALERLNVHLVSGNPTIGIGFDMKAGGKAVQRVVLKALGLREAVVNAVVDGTSPPAVGTPEKREYDYVKQLQTLMTGPNNATAFTAVMATRAADADPAYVTFMTGQSRRATFSFSDDSEVRTVFDELWENKYKKEMLDLRPELKTDTAFHTSYEMIVAASLTWNGGPAESGTFGPGLRAALQANNRAKAWFEIRYGSNGGASEATVGPGLAKRRYLESQMFGLYDDANSVGLVEAKAVFQMLLDKRDKIIAYEVKYGRLPEGRTASRLTGDGRVPLDAANADYATAGILGDTQSIPSSAQRISLIDISLNPAKTALLTDLRVSNPDIAAQLNDAQWISTSIYLNGDFGGTVDSAKYETGTFTATGAEDLMVGGKGVDVFKGNKGKDLLLGNAGVDILDAGEGDDTLIGGADNDSLKGGAGTDVYAFSANEGSDTIADSDGLGEIKVAGTKLNGAGVEQYQLLNGKSIWSDASGLTYSYRDCGTPTVQLTITGGALGSGVIHVEDFDPAKAAGTEGYLGLKLKPVELAGLARVGESNPFAAIGVTGKPADISSQLNELGAVGLTFFGSVAAEPGDTITIKVKTGDASKVKLCNGAETVSLASPVTLALAPGQSSLSLGFMNDTSVDADASIQIEATFTHNGVAIVSNVATLNLKDSGAITTTWKGDQHGPVMVDGDGHQYYDWNSTTRLPDGTLTGGVSDPTFGDSFDGAFGNDRMLGLGGNDALDGNQGNDEIDGGVGDDMIGGGTGSDKLYGGEGNDYIIGSASLNVRQRWTPTDVWAHNGYRQPDGSTVLAEGPVWAVFGGMLDGELNTWWAGPNAPEGTDADYVDGGAGNDSIIVGAGDDRVLGGTGDDEIDGCAGNDVLEGGDGKDIIRADGTLKTGFLNTTVASTHGADFVDGGAGDDSLYGSGGSDSMYGGADNDKMWGDDWGPTTRASYVDPAYHGNDYMDGEGGDDYLEGGGKDDTLYGGDGKDTLWGDTSATFAGSVAIWGNDYLDGEAGDDSLIGGGGDDALYGGDGNDDLCGDESDAALPGAVNGKDYLDGEGGNDLLFGGGNDDVLFGGAGNDQLVGDDDLTKVAAEFQGSDYLDGEDGDDMLIGGGGNDILLGGAGKDVLDGGTGADYMAGGEGDDTYVVDNVGDVVVEADSAAAPVTGSAPAGVSSGGDSARFAPMAGAGPISIDSIESSVNYALGANLDNLKLTGSEAISGSGNEINNTLLGNGAANTLDGGAGNDYLEGGAGDDTLLGGDGNDQLVGGDGADQMAGGAGDDFYWVDDVAALVIEVDGEGTDTVSSSVSLTLTSNVENLQAAGSIAINLTGNALDNGLFGNSVANMLSGGSGADFLDAKEGDDSLLGGSGNDALIGGEGDDTYAFNVGDGQDVIDNTDFLSDSTNPGRSGAWDVLQFGAGIDSNNLYAYRSGNNLILKVRDSTDQVTVADYYASDLFDGTVTRDHKIDGVWLSNGWFISQTTLQTMVDQAASNLPPVLVGSVPDLSAHVGSTFHYTLPDGLFSDPERGALTYRIAMQDGSQLPAWLSFDAATRTLVAAPGAQADGIGLSLSVTATDRFDASNSVSFGLSVDGVDTAPYLRTPLLDQAGMQGAALYYKVPVMAFVDPDMGDMLSYSATLADGSALPAWLTFTPQTREFTGTPAGLGSFSVRVVAKDGCDLSVDDVFDIDVTPLVLDGTRGNDALSGTAAGDTIKGFGGDDQLSGYDGSDTLVGGAGRDTLSGGTGDDTYVVGHGDQQEVILESGGSDTLRLGSGVAPAQVTLSRVSTPSPNFVNPYGPYATAVGTDSLVISLGVGQAQVWVPGYFDDTSKQIEFIEFTDGGTRWNSAEINARLVNLSGAANAQSGTAGDDVFTVDNAQDTVSDAANAGTDTVNSSVSFRLPNNVENLTLTGHLNAAAMGNDLGNTLSGNDADNVLNGLVGADTLVGGKGDDVYAVTSDQPYYGWWSGVGWRGDTVVEQMGEGQDTILTNYFRVTLPDNVENLMVTPVGDLENTFSRDQSMGFGYFTYEAYYQDQRAWYVGNALDNVIDATNQGTSAGVSAANWNGVWEGALLDGGAGADTLVGGDEATWYVVDDTGDVVIENGAAPGIDVISSSTISLTAVKNVEVLELTGSLTLSASGDVGANDLRGSRNTAANVLTGLAGDDTYWIGLNDVVVEAADGGVDTVVIDLNGAGAAAQQSSGKTFYLADYQNVEVLEANGYSAGAPGGANEGVHLVGTAANNTLRGSFNNDEIEGGAGDDWIEDAMRARGYQEYITYAADADKLYGGDGNDHLTSFTGNDLMDGGAGDDVLLANAGNSILLGGAGADTLTGGAGADTIDGGLGNDLIVFGDSDGHDTLRESLADTAPDKLNVLRFRAGVAPADVSLHRSGSDLLVFLRNSDAWVTVQGFYLGDSAVHANNPLQRIEFHDGTAWDLASIAAQANANPNHAPALNLPLPDHALVYYNDVNILLDRDSFSDVDADDVLTYSATLADGSALPAWWGLTFDPRDLSFTGTAFQAGTFSVKITAVDRSGASVSDVFDMVVAIPNLTLNGTADADTLVGGEGNDTINGLAGDDYMMGSGGDDLLDGGTGNDQMVGGAGDDTYMVDSASDVVTESAGAGTDTVQVGFTYTLGANVENLTLTGNTAINGTGNSLANTINGTGAANLLDGGTGADTLVGGAGNDTYVVDNTGDVVTELAGEGIDSVTAKVSYTLGAEVENLTLTGTSAINATGNALANVLTGNSAANVLDGGAGADTLVGGTGNDTYVVDSDGDVVTEAASAGTDLVKASINYTLGTNLENLTLTGTAALNATGNTAVNILTGNSGNNVLDGGAGADTMAGGAGDDTYLVDITTDVVTEAASAGTDTVQSSVSYTLGANVENLTLAAGTSVINGTGNTLNNILIGNSAANTLNGGTGADTLVGGLGNDTYVVDNAADVVTENASEGTDLVQASVSCTLSANVENLTLTGTGALNGTGNALANTIAGNSGANVLDGGGGADTMVGGAGNDSYHVDTAGDITTEAASAGTDTVLASLNWTLGTNLENLTLTGTANLNGTGNTVANVLTGNAGDNVLNGGTGTDTMVGGAGNDSYVLDVAADVVTEGLNAGTDTVQIGVAYTLGANVENLTLTGTGAINGTGNTLNNVLTGNSGNNTLTGAAGNDTLDGGTGADTLVGGTGNDTYKLGRSYGGDAIQENDATAGNTDVLQCLSGIAVDQLWFRQVANNLEVSIIGTSDKATLTNWYLGSQYHVEQFKTSDGKTLLDSQVQNMVNAMAAFAPPAAGQTTLSAAYQTALNPVIAANWQ